MGLLPAAGRATRLGIDGPKELLVHRGRPVIDHSVAHLAALAVDAVVVVTRPGKEAVLRHLRAGWPAIDFVEVVQPEPIGALVDALRCAVPVVAGHDVVLLFPDTWIEGPEPFAPRLDQAPAPAEIVLYCHDAAAGEAWRNFGVVDPVGRRVVEKPSEPLGSTWCWGAAWWRPPFTERLATAATLTDAINAASWQAARSIEHYEDVGLAPGLIRP